MARALAGTIVLMSVLAELVGAQAPSIGLTPSLEVAGPPASALATFGYPPIRGATGRRYRLAQSFGKFTKGRRGGCLQLLLQEMFQRLVLIQRLFWATKGQIETHQIVTTPFM